MRILVLLLLSLSVALALPEKDRINEYVKQLNKLSKEQKSILNDILNLDLDKGMELEMATIAWKESNFGVWMVNITDGKHGSFGIYHIRLDYALVRNKITSSWQKSRYAERLLYDFELSSNEAVTLLNYWKNYYRHKAQSQEELLIYMFSSYNGGYKLSNQALEYGYDAILRLEALKIFLGR